MIKYHIEARNWSQDYWQINETTESKFKALRIIFKCRKFDIVEITKYTEDVRT